MTKIILFVLTCSILLVNGRYVVLSFVPATSFVVDLAAARTSHRMYRTPMDSTKRPSFHLPIVRAAAAAGGDGDDPIDTNNESMNDPFATSTETATTTSR